MVKRQGFAKFIITVSLCSIYVINIMLDEVDLSQTSTSKTNSSKNFWSIWTNPNYTTKDAYIIYKNTFEKQIIQFYNESIEIIQNPDYKTEIMPKYLQNSNSLNSKNLCQNECPRGHTEISDGNIRFQFRDKIPKVDGEDGNKSCKINATDKVFERFFNENDQKKELDLGLKRFLEGQPFLSQIIEEFVETELDPEEMYNFQLKLDSEGKLLKSRETEEGFKNFNTPQFYHFISFGCDRKFDLFNFIAILAVFKFSPKNSRVFLHKTSCTKYRNLQPGETNWLEKLLTVVPEDRFILVKLTGNVENELAKIYHARIHKIEHQTDLYRLIVLYLMGGTYLDLDSWLISPIDEILMGEENTSIGDKKPTLGYYSACSVSNAFISSPKKAEFIGRWISQFKHYNQSHYDFQWAHRDKHRVHVEYWSKFSVNMAYNLWQAYPNLVNIVERTIMRPSKMAMKYLRYGFFDWRKSKAVHVSSKHFHAGYKFQDTATIEIKDVDTFNCIESSLAELARLILFGNFKSCNMRNLEARLGGQNKFSGRYG